MNTFTLGIAMGFIILIAFVFLRASWYTLKTHRNFKKGDQVRHIDSGAVGQIAQINEKCVTVNIYGDGLYTFHLEELEHR